MRPLLLPASVLILAFAQTSPDFAQTPSNLAQASPNPGQASPNLAQTSPNLEFRGPARNAHATVTGAPAALDVKARSKVALFVDVIPNPNIHVYAPGARDFIPITVKLEPQRSIKIGKVSYPKAETMTFADQMVPVFQKPFRLTQDVTIGSSLKPGATVSVTGTVSFQACDDKVCFPPESAPIAWTLTIR